MRFLTREVDSRTIRIRLILLCCLLAGTARPVGPGPCCGAAPPVVEPQLSPQEQRQADSLEKQIAVSMDGSQFEAARVPANKLIELRRRVLGESHWQTADARRTLETLQRLVALTPPAQAEYASVRKLAAQANALKEKGSFREAEPLLRRVADAYSRLLGENAAATLESRSQLGINFDSQGRDAEAEKVLLPVLAQRRRVLGEDHPDTYSSAGNLAMVLSGLGRHAEAEKLLIENLKRRRKKLGEEHLDTAQAYHSLGYALNEQGKYTDAEKNLRRAVAIRKKRLGDEHQETLSSLGSLAFSLSKQDRRAEGLQLEERILAIRQRTLGESHPDTATSLNNLAIAVEQTADYKRAEKLLRQALAIRRKVLGENHPYTALTENNLGHNLNEQGRYADAERHYRNGLLIQRKVWGERHTSTAQGYNNTGAALVRQGKYAEAVPLMYRALRIWSELFPKEDYPDLVVSYGNIAFVLSAQGKHAEAAPLFEKSLELSRRIHGEDHLETAWSYSDLAANLRHRGKLKESEAMFRKALEVRERKLTAKHPQTVLVRHNLANVLASRGQLVEAEKLFRDVVAARRQLLGDRHPFTALSVNSLALTLDREGKHKEAEPLYREALAVRETVLGPNHPDTTASLFHLGANLLDQGKAGVAERILLRERDSFEAARLGVNFSGVERSAFAADHSPYPRLAALLARRGEPTQAWQQLEAHLARGLLDDLSARQVRPLTQEERDREKKGRAQLQQLEKQITALMTAKKTTPESTKQIEQLHRQRDAAWSEFSQFQADLVKKHGPAAGQVFDLDAVQPWLAPDDALIAWLDVKSRRPDSAGTSEHWACVVRASGVPVFVRITGNGPDGTWTEADERLAEQVRAQLGRRPDEADRWQGLSGRLYEQRFGPLADPLGATGPLPAVRRLIVLPSESLRGIPVEALLATRPAGSAPFVVSYAPSATMFAWLRHRQAEANAAASSGATLLALGDPVFTRPGQPDADSRRSAPLAQLPGTAHEVKAIARLFDRAETFLGSRASEQELLRLVAANRLSEFRYLHLATHGILDEQIAMRSALVLAQDRLADPLEEVLAGRVASDGRLSAGQIFDTWKLDADLVTLSACQTGVSGQYSGGEGYLGFAQAIFVAGGRTLVLSQWPVSDDATALLMNRFYENLLGKRPGLNRPLGKAEALHEAKDWLRQLTFEEAAAQAGQVRGEEPGPGVTPVAGSGQRYAHPFYWAGFILIGDPGELSPAPKPAIFPAWPWALGGLLAVLGVGGAVWFWRRSNVPAGPEYT